MDDNIFERSIPVPDNMKLGDAADLIDVMNEGGFKCKLIAGDDDGIFIVMAFETKEKAVEAKMKYL